MNLWSWKGTDQSMHLGASYDDDSSKVLDITMGHLDVRSVDHLWQQYGSVTVIRDVIEQWLSEGGSWVNLKGSNILVPVPIDECWAAGVTYEQSRDARVEESRGAQLFYEHVYTAVRPELFFKSPGQRVMGPGQVMGLRRDADWNVPEPELTVILAPGGEIFGFTIGNDLSSRDIEGENPLYLPQAKIFHGSASVGPSIKLAGTVDPYELSIELTIYRRSTAVFRGAITTAQMRRKIDELVRYLRHEWPILGWTALMTGTSLVPPASFHLESGDEIAIFITGIGTLENSVRRIAPDWVSVPEV